MTATPWRCDLHGLVTTGDCQGCDDELIALADETTKTCHKCKRPLRVGESAWVEDWKVITPDGVRTETRYTCDDCEATP